MKKKIAYFLVFCVICSCLFTLNVSAKESYYVNENGVSLTKAEYDFLTFMFWDGSQELMTLSDYDKFIKSDIMNGTLKTASIDDSNANARGTTIQDTNRTLKISTSCSSDCLVSVTLTWKNNPTIKSYDVIGAYLEGTSLKNTPTTVVSSSTGTTNSNERKTFSNGFGVSVELPKYGNSIVVNQNYRVSTGGHVYASYQHATKAITLANSKNYTISKSGYGKVFNFSGIASSTYDKMNGVDIAV